MKISALSNRKVLQISCGDYHSIALTEYGEVFTWGGGGQYNKGQCGHGDIKDIEVPKRLEFFKNKRPMKVVCGGYHTMVLCDENILYGFGKGTYGQCGYGVAEDTSTPKLVKFSKKFVNYEVVKY
jgi:alpha-tubulin suppressor-like RCC1 family protein